MDKVVGAYHIAMFGRSKRGKEDVRERKRQKREKDKKNWWNWVQRRYKEPRWVENRKAIHAKVRGIPLGRGHRQKLGIERKDSFILTWWYGKVPERD